MSCRSDHSRCGVPTAPRKYLVVTMFAALTLQDSGNSTPRCSKLIEPSRQLVMTTSRRSHATSSYGCTPSVVQTRCTLSPVTAPFFAARDRLVVTPSPAISSAPSSARPPGHASSLSESKSSLSEKLSVGTVGRPGRIGAGLRGGPERLDLPLEVGQ